MSDESYAGTASPLRGLSSFAESERELFLGRDRERSELLNLVGAEGFRAGLFYGEGGCGKTSLLRAALQGDLRDQGVLALYCEDNARPIAAFASALSEGLGLAPNDGETPIAFLARVTGEVKQSYLFILDDIDLVMNHDEEVVNALAELFTRVVTRSAGRARFLFACSSDRVHRFAVLEKRTGSLFPPTSRYELPRMQAPEALVVLSNTLAMADIGGHEELATAVVKELSSDGLILPADLQIAALALSGESLSSAAEVEQIGGYAELQRRWISNAAKACGNERASMRLLAQLASGSAGVAFMRRWLATRAGTTQDFAEGALAVLQERGLVRAYPVADSDESQYALSHEVLASRVREQAAPARISAQHAFDALGAKAAQDKALSPMEYLEIKREGIVPTSPREQAALARTRLLGKITLGALAAFPVLVIVIAYTMMSGKFYLDTAYSKEGIKTIVVRAGKPSMSFFDWLPKSPSFGSIVADTGLTESMVSPKDWRLATSNDMSGELDGESYAKQARTSLTPRLAQLVQYARTGEAAALEALHKGVQDSDDFVQLLHSLRAITKGSPEEVQLVQAALKDPSAAVQTEALMVAVAAASRQLDSYDELLGTSLGSSEAPHRHLSFSAVRTLDAKLANALYQAAIDQGADGDAKLELQALLAGGSKRKASAASATTILLGKKLSAATRMRAHAMLTRAFEADADAASEDAKRLIGNEEAQAQDRVLALTLLVEHAPKASLPGLEPAVELARKSKKVAVRAAALPLSARIKPAALAGDLGLMLEQSGTLPLEMQIAAALAWGQVARMDPSNRDVAKVALERLLKSEQRGVRGAAANAYGYVGRSAQADLAKMIKVEFSDVAESAAYGLANTVASGAPVGNAIGGIRDMWRRKGRLRRIAARVYARLARTKPGPAYFYISASARASDDTSLHPIGMRGLCNSLKAGTAKVGKDLSRAASDPQVEVRRIAIQCVVDYDKFPEVSAQVAAAMVNDVSGDIRADSARVLARLAEQSESVELVGKALSKMIGDESRDVRLVAIKALASLGTNGPESARKALPAAFGRGDEGEKLIILNAAASLGSAELVQRGIADASPLVRIAALDTSIETKTEVSAVLSAALTDSDTSVRRAAIQHLSDDKHGMSKGAVMQALALSMRDKDPTISDLAMMTNARVGDPERVSEQLARSLQSRSEEIRARAATASLGLVAHSPKLALELLTPLLSDPSHDVRVAMLPALAQAYASTMDADELGSLLRQSETRANRRLALSAAFLTKATVEGERDAVIAALEKTTKKGPALAKLDAALALELLAGSADGLAFLRLLVP